MVMFYLMSRRKINLVRLILDFILAAINAKKRRLATLSYGIFLTRVFTKAQLPLDRHRADNKRPTTMMKTLSTLGLKPKHKKKKRRKRRTRRRNIVLLLLLR